MPCPEYCPTDAFQMPLIIPAYYPPLSTTVADEVTLDENWDDDTLFKQYLRSLPEPTEVSEFGRLDARVRCVRARIRELVRARTQLAPHRNASLEGELAKENFRRKVLGWRLFRILELPAELLVEIFRYVVLSTHVGEGEVEQKQRLTWVCRHFRHIAIKDGTLWGRIVFNDAPPWERSQNFLHRADATPLDIHIDDTGDGMRQLSETEITYLAYMLKLRARNLRSLSVSLANRLGPWFFISMFHDVSAPMLDYFQLDLGLLGNPYLWAKNIFHDPESAAPIPLFNGDAPNITRLQLNGISVKWNTIQSQNLRTLDLRRLAPDVSPTIEEFRALISAPNLAKMRLHAASPVPAEGQQRLPAVYMPKLQELRLTDLSCEAAMTVLACMHAPGVRILSFICFAGMDYTPFYAMLRPYFPKVEVLILEDVQVENTENARGYFTCWLDMMTNLRLLSSQREPTETILSLLSQSPVRYRSPLHPLSRARQGAPPLSRVLNIDILAPALRELDLDEVDPGALAYTCVQRDMAGFPLSTIKVPRDIWDGWAIQERDMLKFLDKRLVVPSEIPPDGITSEEQLIRDEMEPEIRV